MWVGVCNVILFPTGLPFMPSYMYSYEMKIKHYRVRRNENSWVTVDDEDYFENLVKLVEVCHIVCVSLQEVSLEKLI